MVGNVNGVVESFFRPDQAKVGQNASNAKTASFSDYLDSALLSYRTGLLTGGLGSNYSYLNALTGQTWQTAVLEALRDELKKSKQTEDLDSGKKESKASESGAVKEKKQDWARIRVINRYQSPAQKDVSEKKGILV